jgi:hypothetical protein
MLSLAGRRATPLRTGAGDQADTFHAEIGSPASPQDEKKHIGFHR